MNILMLGRWLPPPRRPVRAMREYQFARHLARSHRLTLAFVNDSPDAAGSISVLRGEFRDLEFAAVARGWKALTSAVRSVTGESCTLSYFRSEALRTRLAERQRREGYDLLFVSSSSMIQYALDMDPTIPMLLDCGDVDSEWWLRQADRRSLFGPHFFRTEAVRLRNAEAAGARRARTCVAGSVSAARIVESFGAEARIAVVPSGFEVSETSPRVGGGRIPTVVLNTSLADEAEIRDALKFNQTVMTEIWARNPRVRFLIVSREPAANSVLVSQLKGAELATSIVNVEALLRGATVAVAPLHLGGDVRRSVLEPMAVGLPVVATRKAAERLTLEPAVVAGDEPKAFAAGVVQLLEDEGLRAKVGAQGKILVAAQYGWPKVCGELAELVEALAPGRVRIAREPLGRVQR